MATVRPSSSISLHDTDVSLTRKPVPDRRFAQNRGNVGKVCDMSALAVNVYLPYACLASRILDCYDLT